MTSCTSKVAFFEGRVDHLEKVADAGPGGLEPGKTLVTHEVVGHQLVEDVEVAGVVPPVELEHHSLVGV